MKQQKGEIFINTESQENINLEQQLEKYKQKAKAIERAKQRAQEETDPEYKADYLERALELTETFYRELNGEYMIMAKEQQETIRNDKDLIKTLTDKCNQLVDEANGKIKATQEQIDQADTVIYTLSCLAMTNPLKCLELLKKTYHTYDHAAINGSGGLQAEKVIELPRNRAKRRRKLK